MRPTLYADDLTPDFDFDVMNTPDAEAHAIVALARVLPLRCPVNHPMPVESPSLCIGCDGTGFTYPDPPTDGKIHFYPDGREKFLRRVWAEMGILEE